MPPPGEIELRESSSPISAHTMFVSDGAMARSPMEITRSWSNTGRKVVPALVVFQIPPAAAAKKNVRDGLGMPSTSVIRPAMLAGPMGRQRKAARSVESSGAETWAASGAVEKTARAATAGQRRKDIATASDKEWLTGTAGQR